ncbi:MAG: efflux RND transporter periplasmic adaptor subunit [Planctomycetaceae bacterium]
MTDNSQPNPAPHREHVASDFDEGGLRAPPGLKGWRKAWWWFDFIILVKLARLRFIAVLAVIGVVITQWDLLAAYYDRWTRPADAVAGAGSDVEWFCPMHPSIVRDNGKEKCPICFMPLSKRKKGEAHEEALPAGVVNRVQLSPYRVVLAGIRTWTVDYQPLMKEINAVGYVEFNERAVKNVSARVNGRIDTLNINETGQMVQSGDVLASIYSPELLVTVQNLLQRAKATTPISSTARGRGSPARDQRRPDRRDRRDRPCEHAPENPLSDHRARNQEVCPGRAIRRRGDAAVRHRRSLDCLDPAQVYEDDLAFLPNEQVHAVDQPPAERLPVTATTRAFPGEEFQGLLTFIYPHVDQKAAP